MLNNQLPDFEALKRINELYKSYAKEEELSKDFLNSTVKEEFEDPSFLDKKMLMNASKSITLNFMAMKMITMFPNVSGWVDGETYIKLNRLVDLLEESNNILSDICKNL